MISGIRDNNVGEITPISKSYTIAGKTYTFETGTFALLIDGAVTIKDSLGHVLLTTAGISKKGKPGADFFPLSVDYQERFYSTGHIGGGRFNKREARPATSAILNSRLIDRPIPSDVPKRHHKRSPDYPNDLLCDWQARFRCLGYHWCEYRTSARWCSSV